MRGIAASIVMLCHFTYANDNFRAAFPLFSLLFKYGYLGVWMFFVISGFVIPLSMDSINYKITNGAWPFLLRRVIRLEPPYIVSVVLACLVAYAAAHTPGYQGAPFSLSAGEFLIQFLYLGPWFNMPWINGVAWTLAIEFQYYLLMLVFAPLLLARSQAQRSLFFCMVILSSLTIEDSRAVFFYMPCFAVGLVVFLYHSRRIGGAAFVVLCVLFIGLTGYNNGIPPAIVAAFSVPLILLPLHQPIRLLSFLGAISYSLYLVHQLVGDRIVNLLMRLHSSWVLLAGLVAAIGTSLLAAIILWYFVERPSQARARMVSGL